jgi:hypothetical protein
MARQFSSSTNNESFEATVKYLQDRMHEKGSDISDSEIAQKLNIPVSTYFEYVEKDSAPEEIFARLKREFKDVLNGKVIGKVDLGDDDISESFEE